MDFYTRRRESLAAVKEAESKGLVADSMEYRIELMNQVHRGERTLADAQAELKRVKRNAKKNGQITRNQAYTGR
jgi:hypothetical protein